MSSAYSRGNNSNNEELDKDLDIQCQWCSRISKLEEWNTNTYGECTSREMRRAYIKLSNAKVFKHDSGKFYKCPKCGQWLKGSQLIVKSDNEVFNKLGGEPIIQFKK